MNFGEVESLQSPEIDFSQLRAGGYPQVMSGSNNHSCIVGSFQLTGINGIDVFRRQTVP